MQFCNISSNLNLSLSLSLKFFPFDCFKQHLIYIGDLFLFPSSLGLEVGVFVLLPVCFPRKNESRFLVLLYGASVKLSVKKMDQQSKFYTCAGVLFEVS
ncbi:hypothetical protein V6N13_020289 [Hibiscus sabdariffa]|uniref:Uncharacterized protein n=1 Tax=Hibiscus sabdariffa TaxID=183260 RepID=A0ABR2ET05_9ROSI